LEWEFVVNPVFTKDYPGIIRKPQPLDHFLSHETAQKAGLEDTEIIALRLFTGPMVMLPDSDSDPDPDPDTDPDPDPGCFRPPSRLCRGRG
jgi:hypothetical protein